MMRILFSIFAILVFHNFLFAQLTYFNLTYNPNNTWAIGNSIIEYNGSYYITGGTSDSIAQYQSIFIGNVDVDGNLIYWQTYGGYPYAYWSGYTNSLINTTSLGELVLAGCRTSSGSNGLATYYNFNINGDTNFTMRYPDTNYTGYTSFNQCKQTSDGGLIFVGKMTIEQYNSDILLLKTDHTGQEQWRRHYGKPITWAIDHGYNVLETADSGFLIGYYYYIAGQEHTGNPYVMKVDKLGNYEWEVNLGGPYEDLLATVCHSNDGNYICAASISDSTIDDILFTKVNIFKVSTDGEVIWSKTIGDQHLWNKVHGIYQDHNGGYIAVGFRHGLFNSMEWNNTWGWICKMDENGDSIWWREYKHFIDPEWHMNELYDLHLTSDGGYIAVGQTATIYDPQQTWLMKVDSFGCDTPGCQTVGILEPQYISKGSLLIYPNPAIHSVNIRYPISDPSTGSGLVSRYSISIYDMFGRKIDKILIPKGQEVTQVDVSSYSRGIYIAVLQSEKKVIDRKKFLVKN